MKAIKVIVILGLVFGISYSCSTVRPLGKNKEATSQLIHPIIISPKIVDTIIEPRRYNFKEDFQSYLEESINKYKIDNLKLSGEVYGLRAFVDSLARREREANILSNRLVFDRMSLMEQEQESQNKLLLEREKNAKLSKQNRNFQVQAKTGENYMATFLSTGLAANLIMTIALFFYKRRSIKQLKRLNLIHA